MFMLCGEIGSIHDTIQIDYDIIIRQNNKPSQHIVPPLHVLLYQTDLAPCHSYYWHQAYDFQWPPYPPSLCNPGSNLHHTLVTILQPLPQRGDPLSFLPPPYPFLYAALWYF